MKMIELLKMANLVSLIRKKTISKFIVESKPLVEFFLGGKEEVA